MVMKTNPFQEDCLKREEFASAIKFFIKKISPEGGAIAINAQAGMGKTWFCDCLSKYLENDSENFETPIKIDAFFEDYHGDPLWTIAKKFNDRFKKNHKAKEAIRKIVKFSLPLTKLIDGGLITHELIEPIISQYLEEPDPKTLIDNNKKLLGDSVKEGKILVVLIDELDRCRPDFAVNLIEKIKHYFEIPRIVFVLMINSEQNYEHFKKIYGQGINAQGYLEKFLKLPLLNLPEKHSNDLGIKTYPENHFVYKIYEHFFRNKYHSLFKENSLHSDFLQKLAAFSQAMKLSYREQEKATLIIALLNEKLKKNGLINYAACFVPLSLKRPDLMNKVLNGEGYRETLNFLKEIKSSYYVYGKQEFFEHCINIYKYCFEGGNPEDIFKGQALMDLLLPIGDFRNAPKYLAQIFTTPNF